MVPLYADAVEISTMLPYVIAVVAALAGAVTLLFKLYAGVLTKRISDLEGQNQALMGVAREGVTAAKEAVNEKLLAEGKPTVPIVAPVVAEGSSPPTVVQLHAAELATMRASLAAIKLAAGQEPRLEPNGANPHDGGASPPT